MTSRPPPSPSAATHPSHDLARKWARQYTVSDHYAGELLRYIDQCEQTQIREQDNGTKMIQALDERDALRRRVEELEQQPTDMHQRHIESTYDTARAALRKLEEG